MSAELLKIHPRNPEQRKIDRVVKVLQDGGVVVYPTDTVYALGCDATNRKAVERLSRIRGIRPQKLNLSLVCADISEVARYVRRIETPDFKVLRKALPGPFTFIFEAGANVSRIIGDSRKTLGVRIPDHLVSTGIVRSLGNPLISSSIHDDDAIRDYITDPDDIYQQMKHVVDIVIDSGAGGNIPSTVVDCTGEGMLVIRQGLGDLEQYL